VAAGRYDTPVLAAGPAELADLGRAAELMRARLVTTLAEAERAEARFRGLLEAAPDAVICVDGDGRIVLVNAQTERLFGYGRDELAGQPVEMLVPDAVRDAHPGHRAGYLADPRPRPMGAGMELAGRRRDGSTFPAEISVRDRHRPGNPGLGRGAGCDRAAADGRGGGPARLDHPVFS
jgi:PAS domain S-box-containing protein